MKNILVFGILMIASYFTASGQTNAGLSDTMTAKFKVYGNCGMCEKRIEKAAKIEGVYFADWSEETLILTIKFDLKKVKPSQVEKAVAAVGHDTQHVRADDAVYANLHSCCQYERRKD
ncbi:MAG: heavy-metal-associated domain-containing protein [Saprospiraceae bacterium]|nr:heavy-metal-associated domain-containing protein [Saprospiraceae bacterium]